MKAKSIKGRSTGEIQSALQKSLRALKGKQEFHSGACCWVALKEK